MSLKAFLLAAAVVSLCGAPAWAQGEAPPPPPEPMPAPAAAPAPVPGPPLAPPAALAPRDGMRFRWGVSAAGGLEKVSVISGPMFGVDARFGLQLNHLLGFYLQPHLSFGKLSGESTGGFKVTGFTGTFSVAAMAEATLMDRFFAAAGAGYGVLNNPSGAMIQARVGGYPLVGRGLDGIRRRGLMVGVDIRAIFIDGATGLLVLGAVGYEAF
jgi:hypothetical protein